MKVYRSFNEIDHNLKTVLTVGTYDGVHKGHNQILNRLISSSVEDGLRHVLLTIHPHPRTVLKKNENDVKLLTSIDERIELFRRFGLENVLIIPFTLEFSKTTPESFVRDYLFAKVGLSKILIGHDHMFGKNREGDSNLLSRLGAELNFEVEEIKAFTESDITVSSTKIRKALESGDITSANMMLGYDYIVRGEVVVGDKRGRTIGYPTANIRSSEDHKLFPANGVYLVSSIIDSVKYYGMANIGFRPTFEDTEDLRFEVHYFDMNMDLYGEVISVEFIERIRDEKKFSGPEALIQQLNQDKQESLQLIDELSK